MSRIKPVKACSKIKKHIGYADVGTHGGIFEFQSGPVGDRYPHLLHIFSKKLTPDLVKVIITEYPSKTKHLSSRQERK